MSPSSNQLPDPQVLLFRQLFFSHSALDAPSSPSQLSSALAHQLFETMPDFETRLRELALAAKDTDNASGNNAFTAMLQMPSEDRLRNVPKRRGTREDPVLHQIRTVIQELNCRLFEFFILRVRVYATTASRPALPIGRTEPTFLGGLYTFFDDFSDYPLSVLIQVYPPTGKLTSEKLYVKMSENWWPLRQWLQMKKSGEPYVEDEGYKLQSE